MRYTVENAGLENDGLWKMTVQTLRGCNFQPRCLYGASFSSGAFSIAVCTAVRSGLESCGEDGTCRRSMTCRDGRCQCSSDGGRMTPDRQHCLADNQRLLNDRCSVDRHVCKHLAGICACMPSVYSVPLPLLRPPRRLFAGCLT